MFNTEITVGLFIESLYQTLIMTSVSLIIGTVFGIILALVLYLTKAKGLKENLTVYSTLNVIINIIRSLPFIILIVAILPFTKLIVGSSIGVSAAIVPLILFIAPYIARLFENSLLEVNEGIIEAADSMGASIFQIIRYFLLPEAKSSLILSFTTATIGLIGATAMAGAVGAGGIGDLAISYGYQRFDTMAMVYTVISLIIIVQIIQSLGNKLSKPAYLKRK